jgi:glycosyltransferase involved in cell wall biosynthesis
MPSRDRPLVSVIIPAFNASATLRESAASALCGTYERIEVVIVDDGSTDSTVKVAEEIAGADARARLLRRENGGVSAAFNTGLAEASGEYVARLDADDLWHPAKLERQVNAALDRPDVALLYTDVRYIDAEGRLIRDVAPQDFPQKSLCRGIYESVVGGNSSALMLREAVIQAGGYDEALTSWEDLLLQLRISARHPIAHVPGFLVGYRVRPGSLSARPENMLASWRVARERIKAHFPQVPSYVLDWAHGKRCAELAESFAWTGSWAMSASLLLEAFRHDPVWTSRFLAYRTTRRFRNRLAKRQVPPTAPLFSECSPEQSIGSSDYDRGIEGRGLRGLDRRRAELLRALDDRLA